MLKMYELLAEKKGFTSEWVELQIVKEYLIPYKSATEKEATDAMLWSIPPHLRRILYRTLKDRAAHLGSILEDVLEKIDKCENNKLDNNN